MVTLVRAAPAPVVDVRLDPIQAAVVAHRGGRVLVAGAPGTGKTLVAVSSVVARAHEGVAPDRCLLLAAGREGAARLRVEVTRRVGGVSTEPLARTPSSLAWGILRRRAVLAGEPPPRLLTGAEQDAVLRELLDGHTRGAGRSPGWPADLGRALATRGFRAELRDLLTRATEAGLTPAELAELGRHRDRPEWVAAARVAAEYDEVTALSRPGAYDPAALLAAAADALEEDPALAADALPGLALVVVDDAQELSRPGARLVDLLAAPGVDLVVLGDPDSGTQAFRGADPHLGRALARGGASYVLPFRHRHPPALADVVKRVAARIGTGAGHEQRSAVATPGETASTVTEPRLGGPGEASTHAGQAGTARPGEAVRVLVARTASQEAQLIASVLRRAHLVEGTPWSQMAVIVRGRSRTATLRRVLTGARIPVVLPGAHVPLRDEPAVAALLSLLDVVIRVARGEDRPLDARTARDLLLSPLGGLDGLGLRDLRRAVRRADPSGSAPTDDLLVATILAAPDDAASAARARTPREVSVATERLATAIAAGVGAAAREGEGWAAGVSAETCLWAVWSGLDLAESWRRCAVGGGPGSAQADRHLDAVVALFEAAATYVDRLPGRGPDGFVDYVAGQDVAADSLAVRAPVEDAVTLTTPQGAAGREWDVVAVAGVQDGAWPDPRVRGSLLGSTALVDVLAGRSGGAAESRIAVRYDETRLFHVAVSRARRRLVVTAVANEDEQPSTFLALVDPRVSPDEVGGPDRPDELSLTALVARLRRAVVLDPTEAGRRAAARRLLLLASEGVPGADPQGWWPLLPLSSDRARRPEGTSVTVSPSRVEAFGHCGLRWLLQGSGGDRVRAGGADGVGRLVHAIAAEVDNGDAAAMRRELARRWPALGLPPGWIATRQQALAGDMLDRLARHHLAAEAQGWRVVGREVAGALPVGRSTLRGRVDRLESDGEGRLRVIDLKTGARKPARGDLARHPQLGAYQVLAQGGAFGAPGGEGESTTPVAVPPQGPGGSATAGAALLQLGKAATGVVDLQVQGPLNGDDDPAWAARLIEDTAEGMAAARVQARVGDWCRTCQHGGCCPVSDVGGEI